MMLIGTAILTNYGAKRPQTSSTLRALSALIRHATWTSSKDLTRDCGAVIRLNNESAALLELRDAGCDVVLKINYDLGVVRVVAVRDLRED